ncbi:MAG: TolC family protein [Bacteroidales bacterium]|nr:TolC family protein [Bacteroidales bacterium]
MNKIILSKFKLPVGIRLIVFPILYFYSLAPVYSQDLYDLSRCIQIGLDNNFGLQAVRNREEISAINYTYGNAGMLPSVTANNSFGGTVNAVNRNLRDGGETSSTGIHNTSAAASVNLGMTIFRGFQVQNTYRKLGQLNELEGLSTQMAVENLVGRIAAEYNYYIEQLTLYKNLAYAISLSRERVRIDEQRYLLGGASKLELLQSLVYLNADSSRYSRQSAVLRSAQIRLNELMASEDLGKNIVLKDTLIQINEKLTYDELLRKTIVFNTSLQIASKNQIISTLDYQIIKSRSYPYLNLSTGYGYNYNGYNMGDYLNQRSHGMNYGLSLGMDLFDGSNRKREKSVARIGIENTNIQFKEVEQEVKADLLTIFFAYENNIRLLRLEEKNLAVARENLQIALERYKLGNLAGLELREVQKSLLDAEERLISIKYLTKIAEISLMQISGSIMDFM